MRANHNSRLVRWLQIMVAPLMLWSSVEGQLVQVEDMEGYHLKQLLVRFSPGSTKFCVSEIYLKDTIVKISVRGITFDPYVSPHDFQMAFSPPQTEVESEEEYFYMGGSDPADLTRESDHFRGEVKTVMIPIHTDGLHQVCIQSSTWVDQVRKCMVVMPVRLETRRVEDLWAVLNATTGAAELHESITISLYSISHRLKMSGLYVRYSQIDMDADIARASILQEFIDKRSVLIAAAVGLLGLGQVFLIRRMFAGSVQDGDKGFYRSRI